MSRQSQKEDEEFFKVAHAKDRSVSNDSNLSNKNHKISSVLTVMYSKTSDQEVQTTGVMVNKDTQVELAMDRRNLKAHIIEEETKLESKEDL